MKIERREFIGGLSAAGMFSLVGGNAFAAGRVRPVKFILMSDTHIESDFVERGRPVYTCWKPGDHAALVRTYEFINEDPYCRDADFALFCGDQVNTGYSREQSDLDDEMKIYRRTLARLALAAPARDLGVFDFRARPYTCRENLAKGQAPFDVTPPPLASRVIAIQGNHDTGCPEFYRDCSFKCGDVRIIAFFASYVGLPAPKGHYRSTGSVSDDTVAFIEREMARAAADPGVRHIVLACHWSIVNDDPKRFVCPLLDAEARKGLNDNRRRILALAEKYGCDLYLNGHEHSDSWPVGRIGSLFDVNCGTVTAEKGVGAFAVVEMTDERALMTVYSRARAKEDGGRCVITDLPQRLFVREIPLKPIR